MLADEKKCRTFKQNHIEWSPAVRMWMKRRWLLERVQKFISRKRAWSRCRVRNLQRSCRRHKLAMPDKITMEELAAHKTICNQTLKRLRKEAPYLRQCHLIQRKKHTIAQGDKRKAKKKGEVIKREKKKKFFKKLKFAAGKGQGASVMSVRVPVEGETTQDYTD